MVVAKSQGAVLKRNRANVVAREQVRGHGDFGAAWQIDGVAFGLDHARIVKHALKRFRVEQKAVARDGLGGPAAFGLLQAHGSFGKEHVARAVVRNLVGRNHGFCSALFHGNFHVAFKGQKLVAVFFVLFVSAPKRVHDCDDGPGVFVFRALFFRAAFLGLLFLFAFRALLFL